MKKQMLVTTYAYRAKKRAYPAGHAELMASFGPLSPTFEDEEFQIIGTQEVEVDFPDNFNFDDRLVQILQEKKRELMAEFQNRITEIERQIQEHLAIEAK